MPTIHAAHLLYILSYVNVNVNDRLQSRSNNNNNKLFIVLNPKEFRRLNDDDDDDDDIDDNNHLTLHLTPGIHDSFFEPSSSLRENVIVLVLPHLSGFENGAIMPPFHYQWPHL